jgi:CPA1 family monovalent cation:H+ antiporter
MRGVLALAAAYSLPEKLANGQPFAQRDLIVFLTFCVILVTLVGQGLTLPALIRRLGLAGGVNVLAGEEKMARMAAINAAIGWLRKERNNASDEAQHVYDDLLHQYEHRREAVGGEGVMQDGTQFADAMRVAREAAQMERRVLMRLRDEGKIGDETVRAVERELDLAETRIDVVQERFD